MKVASFPISFNGLQASSSATAQPSLSGTKRLLHAAALRLQLSMQLQINSANRPFSTSQARMQPANGASLRALYAWCPALRIALCCIGEAQAVLSAPWALPVAATFGTLFRGCCFRSFMIAAATSNVTGMISGRGGTQLARQAPVSGLPTSPFQGPLPLPEAPGESHLRFLAFAHAQFSDWSGLWRRRLHGLPSVLRSPTTWAFF